MPKLKNTGALVLIGGAEERSPSSEILGRFVELVNGRKLVVMTCATEDPAGAWRKYRKTFVDLGVDARNIAHVDVRDRQMALDGAQSEILEDAGGVFFTGGDQLRITSQIGDTPIYQRIRDLVARGGVVAGTSAGATAMSGTMVVDGESENTPRVGTVVKMAPGLGFLEGFIIDVHFAERGRMGRLVGAVAQNPAVMGIGVDEDTALLIQQDCGVVIGDGGVWIIDGRRAHSSNVAEGASDDSLSIQDVVVHVLGHGQRFDLASRAPVS